MPRKKNNRKQEQKARLAEYPKPQWRGGVAIAPQANAQIGFALGMMADSLAMNGSRMSADFEKVWSENAEELYER